MPRTAEPFTIDWFVYGPEVDEVTLPEAAPVYDPAATGIAREFLEGTWSDSGLEVVEEVALPDLLARPLEVVYPERPHGAEAFSHLSHLLTESLMALDEADAQPWKGPTPGRSRMEFDAQPRKRGGCVKFQDHALAGHPWK